MKRNTSPDITQGVPPPSLPNNRRSSRRRNQAATSVSQDQDSLSPRQSSDTPSGSGGGNEGATESQSSRRGRGRGRGRGGAARATVTPDSIIPGGSVESLPPATSQQPKRRGRKSNRGRPPTSDPTPMESDQQSSSADIDDSPMETISNVAQNLTFQMSDVFEGIKSESTSLPIPMESDAVDPDPTSAASSLFSSVLKSEPSFGQQAGGGIPGLDLDDCEANSATFPSEPVISIAPAINISFGSSVAVDEECKSFQELQITKSEEKIKPTVPVESKNIKVENIATPENTEDNDSSKVRRSSRIKTLEEQRGSRGRRREVVSSLSDSSGLSRSNLSLQEEDSNSGSSINMQSSSGYSSPLRDGQGNGGINSSSLPNLTSFASGLGTNDGAKPFKVKQRWRNSLDAESIKSFSFTDSMPASSADACPDTNIAESFISSDKLVRRRGHLAFDGTDDELLEKLRKFEGIDESIFRTERKISKENKGMVCDCYLSKDEIAQGEVGCTEDCLNRLLMVECGNKCPTAALCSNKRFQRKEYAPLEVFKTEKKGHGLRTLQAIPEGGFVIEYVGEVLDVHEFERRTAEYAKGNQEHFYFMALKSDAIIDATLRGNCSRFINHSCEPNCETQKWTVNGEVRIGFFAISDLQPGDEITFDYQFQRYGKKAQRCFCMTESCRGWIGEEEEDEIDQVEDKDEPVPDAETEVEECKAKVKPKVEKKKRKNVQLEDMAFREELLKLEASGLKNRNHTLTLSRLMVRAESWDDRERLLKILINGDTPCRRLFLDYHGLRLIWSWMFDLPLPHDSDTPQLIRNDVYHMLFIRALQSLPIPNKSLLLESKVLALVEKWCSVPSVTTTITLVKRNDVPPEPKKPDQVDSSAMEEPQTAKFEIMDTSDIKEEPTSTAEGMQEVVEERVWEFVPASKALLDSWADLKEVFRIPKKERVEQMKEHEREADKGLQNSSVQQTSGFSSYSYDRDHRNKQYRNRGERRVPVLDSSQPQFHRDRFPNRMIVPPGVTKEQWRKHFEENVKAREQQEFMRKQQDALVTLHQERCALVGLDPATTPIVDPHGVYYLDPKSVEWKQINNDDPTMPPELIKFVQLSQYPPPATETTEVLDETPVEPEQAFPPWPPGLPPPPPLPPTELPKNWKMAVDDEGRCYYYHIRTKATQWHPPPPDYVSSSESSESSSEEEVEETVAEGSPTITKPSIQTKTWRNKLIERATRRKKSGLVQERIISPRGDDEKGFSKEMVKENKKKALEEKLARLKMKESKWENESEVNSEADEGSMSKSTVSDAAVPVVKSEKTGANRKPSMSSKKRRKEKSSSNSKVPSTKQRPKIPAVQSEEEGLESSSPIETELDLTLSQLDEETDGFFSRVSAGPSRIIGSTPSMDVVMIPGLGFDTRDLDAKKKADRAARHAAKKKALAMQKKSKEKVVVEISGTTAPTDKRLSSKEASTIKDAFRNSIATIVVAHLNPYRKSEHIKTTDDFKHLARKITHAILLKELKHTRDVTSLEVTESVKHKTKEYIKKFMARFPNGVYIRSPENSQTK